MIPIEACLHTQVLVNFENIVRQNDIERDICIRQLVLKDNNSHSWITYGNETLTMYDFEYIFDLLNSMPSKDI